VQSSPLVTAASPPLAHLLEAHDRSACVSNGDTSGRTPLDQAMDRYARGDDAAFAEVYDLLAPRLYGFLLRQTRAAAKAEDLVQQTFLQIVRARGTFEENAAVLPWAFAIARRLFIDSLRRGKREVLAADDDEQPPSARERAVGAGLAAQAPPRPDEALHARQVADRVRLELSRLPDNQRVAFELIKQEGLSVAEAAQILGTTVSAVKLRAHRAYEALRAVLGDVVGKEEGE
jgi:RNA polymerase sigma-70 factor (ECF subfamily)